MTSPFRNQAGAGFDPSPALSGNLREGYSIVVPVYNSETTLDDLVSQVNAALGQHTRAFEILLVNDGSADRSWEMIQRLALGDPHVRGINLMRNYGQHSALLAGIRSARYAVTVTMDDDLQHPPDQIGKLLEKLDDGYDLVYGTAQHQEHGPWREFSSRAIRAILSGATGVQHAPYSSSFRAFRTLLRDSFASYDSPFVSIDVLLTWGTMRVAHVPVLQKKRRVGKSNYNFFGLVAHAVDIMTGLRTWPMHVASVLGVLLTITGGLGLVASLLHPRRISEGAANMPLLVSLMALFSGQQLTALGIIGVYMRRIHFRLMAKPPYAVRGLTDKTQSSEVDDHV